jgi:putative nucleotidyltransferase with HDIG domain
MIMNNFSHQPSSSMTTRKRIACSEIRAGMFLVRIMDSWWRSPFFVHRRLLRPQDVLQLVQSGIREVEIDTSKGLDVALDPGSMDPGDSCEESREVEMPGLQEKWASQKGPFCSVGVPHEEQENRKQLIKVRGDAIAALEHVFEGTKTGQTIPLHALHRTAQTFIQNALAHPAILAEIMLIDHLEQFDKTLYSHVVDTAVLSILIGLQLGWDVALLENVAVAALLHDVGYMRLPLNLVETRWGKPGIGSKLLEQHVRIGLVLIQNNGQCSPEIIQMIGEHHAYQDGSGFPHVQGRQPVSASGKLLGLVDYFDEVLAEGSAAGSFPAALIIRRMYQEAQKGKFPTVFVEAMIRVFGVYPVGTLVALSTGEKAVVVKQNGEASVKPLVKIICAPDGRILQEPELRNLALGVEMGAEIKILKILDYADCSINPREYF